MVLLCVLCGALMPWRLGVLAVPSLSVPLGPKSGLCHDCLHGIVCRDIARQPKSSGFAESLRRGEYMAGHVIEYAQAVMLEHAEWDTACPQEAPVIVYDYQADDAEEKPP